MSSRLRSLVAFYDAFHQALQREADPQAQKLCASWASVKPQYVGSSSAGTPSQLAAGLEQGLRELPMLFKPMSARCRAAASQALASALHEHLPSFAAKQDERLAKLVARGSIRSEREFYLVRHAIEIAESDMQPPPVLSALYSLVERYESRSRRVA